jgi:1-acyl-sn-glycerol-3-phosphate acyltransferase
VFDLVQPTTQLQVEAAEEAAAMRHWLSRLRSYFIWDPLIWTYTIILGSLSLLSSVFDRSGRVQHRFAQLWSRMILGTIGAPVTVSGLDAIDTSRAHVYVVNHLSALDIPLLYVYLPFQFRILAKRELFRYPFMGWHLRRSGQIPVDLENPKKSIRSLNRAVEALKNGMPLVIFPEGGRSEDGQLQPFMGGAFFAAIKAQADVVPMAISGTYETLKMNTWHIKPHPLRLTVGQPVSTEKLTVRDTENLTAQVSQIVSELIEANSAGEAQAANQAGQEPGK